MKKSNVYTRTGDAGTTSLVGGVRVPKHHARLEAYGTIDELNSCLGVLISLLVEDEQMLMRQRFVEIQNDLFGLGSVLAVDAEVTPDRARSAVSEADVERLEHWTDETEDGLPPWRGFILPGGSTPASVCHVCRTVCRRAERRIAAVYTVAPADAQVAAYINRLSDYLFVCARKLNFLAHVDENTWQKR